MNENTQNPLRTKLGDVKVLVKAKVGTRKMKLQAIGTMKIGDTIRLGKLVGESMDIFIADRLMARGEVVVVNYGYGVRLHEIL